MPNRRNAYVLRRWATLIEEYGSSCQTCGKRYDLEFAHLGETGLKGKGRGKKKRLANILQHRDLYRLLCMECHDLLDGMHRKRQPDYLKVEQS